MERRRSIRTKPEKPVDVKVFGSNGGTISGSIADVSAEGLAILIHGPLDVGDIARVDTGEHLIVAEVRHCRQQGSNFSIGLLVTSRVEKAPHINYMRSFQMA